MGLGLLGVSQAVLAQAPAAKADAPKSLLSEAQKAGITRSLELAENEALCATPVSLKVADATLEEIVDRAKAAAATKTNIEVRGPRQARFSFDLQSMPLGNLLDATAALAGCRLFVLRDRLLIAPPGGLSEAEQKDGGLWAGSMEAVSSRWSARSGAQYGVLGAVVTDMMERLRVKAGDDQALGGIGTPKVFIGDVKTLRRVRFGDLSPDIQQWVDKMYHTSIKESLAHRPDGAKMKVLPLAPDAIVALDDSNPNLWNVSVTAQQPDGDVGMTSWGIPRSP